MATRPLLKDRITEELRELVLDAQGPAPVRIESERDLSERFGVSRLVVRNAIQRLVDEGFLVPRRGSGTYVVPKAGITHVGLVGAPDIKAGDPLFHELFQEFSGFLATEAITLTSISTDGAHAPGTASVPVVIVGQLPTKTVLELSRHYRYLVSLQSYPGLPELTQVYFDDLSIGYQAAEQLCNSGHRSVVHLAGPGRFPSAADRRQGFLSGCDVREMEVTVYEGKMNWRGGFDLATKIADTFRGDDRPTGVFAANDWMALGFMQHLRDLGIGVPGDVSVIGCDDIHLASEISPNLSTFRLNTRQLVREAFGILNNMVASGHTFSSKRILIPADFVLRETLRRIDR